MSALLTEGLGNGTFDGAPQRVLLEGLFANPVESLPVNYYTQYYYMLLTGNNPYAAFELPFALVGDGSTVGDGTLVG